MNLVLQNMPRKQKPYLTPHEVAELLMVAPSTVRHWSSEGKIHSLVTPGGHRRFLRSEIDRFSRENGLTLLPPNTETPESETPDSETLRILVIDDDQDVTQFLTKAFKLVDGPVTVQVANNGFDAGRIVNHFRPQVVLLDLMMPGIDGFEVCRTIKQDPAISDTRIVAMTGFYDQNNVNWILEAGAESCLQKPFGIKTLFDAIGVSSQQQAKAP